MTAAIGRQLILAVATGTSTRAIFLLFVLVIPVLLLIAMNLIRLGSSWLQNKQSRK